MTQPFTLKCMAGLVLASMCMAGSAAVYADDVFGGSSSAAQNSLNDRIAALEKQLKELQDKGLITGAAGAPGAASGAQAQLKLTPPPPPPPGLEGLPDGGKTAREQVIVEKDLTYQVIGHVNGELLVRDGDSRYLMTEKELHAYLKTRRQNIVQQLRYQAVSDGDAAKLSFPDLAPPPPPPDPNTPTVNAGAPATQAGDAKSGKTAAGAQPAAGAVKPAQPTVPAVTQGKPSPLYGNAPAPKPAVKKN
ncbi:hypothetical protein KTD31_01100 [Burkholderia multivorans]|uniref:hypothetical protein n=1 Tax=Burkholderia multivorans TaxID=87883 RepID=UPI001C237EDF|nr:hypothetical protein [Burkholderia multivorans]MBU9199999.1 hypothetical protein [Burkholderia multivorans]